MNAVAIIARLTLVETLRRQIHLVTMFLCVVVSLVPLLANVFGLGASDRVVKDVGLTLMGYYGLALAVLFGSLAVPSEIERRTIYPLLARPIPRRAYLWGKWLGLVMFISLSLLVLVLCMLGSSLTFLGHADARLLVALLGYVMEAALVTAVCMLFSTFCSPPLAGVLGFFVYTMGGLPQAFIDFFFKPGPTFDPGSMFVHLVKALLPHFELFHMKDAVVHGEPIPGLYVGSVVLYGMAWVVMAQLLGEWRFERRDL